jgi:glyoxylate reductase
MLPDARRLIHFIVPDHLREELRSLLPQHLPPQLELTDSPTGASVIVTIDGNVTPEILDDAGPSLHLIGRVASPTATIAPTRVPVVDLPRLDDACVAELTVALILALELRVLTIADKTARAEWVTGRDEPKLTDQRRYTFNWVGERLGVFYGKTVGIVGLGRIGRSVAERLHPFGVRVLYTQRHRLQRDEEDRLDVAWRSFDDLLRESDVVTLHHRFEEGPGGNEGHIGTRELRLMKPTAHLVNTARGRLVDEEALVEALREKRIGGAGLDVFRYEPLPREHPLLELATTPDANVILTPHVAGGSLDDYWRVIAEELTTHLE